MKKKGIKLNILMIVCLLIVTVMTTHSWILEYQKYNVKVIDASRTMIVSPTSVNVELYLEDENGTFTLCNNGNEKIIIDNIVPNEYYRIKMRIRNTGEDIKYLSFYLDDIKSEINGKGVRLMDRMWLSFYAISGYDGVTNKIPQSVYWRLDDTNHLLQFNDEHGNPYKQDFEITTGVKLPVTGASAYVEFMCSFILDAEADVKYENAKLEIDSLRIEV